MSGSRNAAVDYAPETVPTVAARLDALESADTGQVPTTRTITAASGLTGGGTLAADRTLSADFGTGAGKVTQGDDARLSDARTPTAHAASHAAAGSDAVTPTAIGASATGHGHVASDVTNLTADIAEINLFVGPVDPRVAISNLAFVANQAYGAVFKVAKAVTVAQALLQIDVQSGNIDIGIYDATGVRLASTGSFACPSGVASQALSASVALVPGVAYYALIAADNATAKILFAGSGYNSAIFTGIRLRSQFTFATAFPLPTPLDLAGNTGVANRAPAVYFIP